MRASIYTGRIGARILAGDESMTWWFDRHTEALVLNGADGQSRYRFNPEADTTGGRPD